MNHRTTPVRILACGALAVLASCGSSNPDRAALVFDRPVRSFPGFSDSNFLDGVFYAQAELETQSKDAFGTDIVERAGALSVQLRITLSGDVADELTIELKSGRMDPHLYLEDGTVLEHVPATQVVDSVASKYKTKVENAAFAPRLMKGRNDEIEGYLFFAVPDSVRLDGSDAYVTDEVGGIHVVDLRRSLLTFDYLTYQNGVQRPSTVSVGLKK
jgi:hypothetical protein